jgi:hypothetical protein
VPEFSFESLDPEICIRRIFGDHGREVVDVADPKIEQSLTEGRGAGAGKA